MLILFIVPIAEILTMAVIYSRLTWAAPRSAQKVAQH